MSCPFYWSVIVTKEEGHLLNGRSHLCGVNIAICTAGLRSIVDLLWAIRSSDKNSSPGGRELVCPIAGDGEYVDGDCDNVSDSKLKMYIN